ncbi:SUF system NifU family Fe-S cluster assembly protein [Oceanotoga sp. DSM 15011]|uniref:Fe-S cluster assembly sulfur transfer protein SufU n=1 Tax=Oceanotoga TaxID=1255275 RepID=UPI0021F41166|nr:MULTISPECIES: SUF system NifU family Fe-S cluster assembly protein [Oceanotoga]MDO7977545.1 SUF system NifU family Fe-S cluster assembly protein [Oceanotoga teriensis]UYO99709.1 SUF system NifU family Fe-S cluster assembly protein [Oceanotoga sp. DSM 15011]
MSLEDLYSEIILDYAKNPQFKGSLENAYENHAKNLSCGDEINLFLKIEDDIIKDAKFEGHGCIISQASTSMLCEALKGLNTEKGKELINEVIKMSQGKSFNEHIIGDLDIFKDISTYPMRIKCFTLAWHTALETIEDFEEG